MIKVQSYTQTCQYTSKHVSLSNISKRLDVLSMHSSGDNNNNNNNNNNNSIDFFTNSYDCYL